MDRPGPLILLIEDEPQMRRFLRTALEANDYRLIEAETAKRDWGWPPRGIPT